MKKNVSEVCASSTTPVITPHASTVSIVMTLCELSTAQHYSAPQECTRFHPDNDMENVDNAVAAKCVEWLSDDQHSYWWQLLMKHRALSRSAQHWSSFSGYMREIRSYPIFFHQNLLSHIFLSYAAQLCTTFQRWHDVGQFDIGCIPCILWQIL